LSPSSCLLPFFPFLCRFTLSLPYSSLPLPLSVSLLSPTSPASTPSVTNPVLLFALAFCVAVWWLMAIKNRGENIKLLGRETGAMEVYLVVGVIMIPVLYFAGAGSTVFWIIGASVVVVLVHAIFISVPADSTATSDPELGGIILEDVTIS
jgi:hypothetical protein